MKFFIGDSLINTRLDGIFNDIIFRYFITYRNDQLYFFKLSKDKKEIKFERNETLYYINKT